MSLVRRLVSIASSSATIGIGAGVLLNASVAEAAPHAGDGGATAGASDVPIIPIVMLALGGIILGVGLVRMISRRHKG